MRSVGPSLLEVQLMICLSLQWRRGTIWLWKTWNAIGRCMWRAFASFFFSLCIIISPDTISLDQAHLAYQVLNDLLGVNWRKHPASNRQQLPMSVNKDILEEFETCECATGNMLKALETKFGFKYRAILLCAVMHLALWTDPDLLLACQMLSQYQSSPGEANFTALKHLCLYLRNNPDMPLVYKWQARAHSGSESASSDISSLHPIVASMSVSLNSRGLTECSHCSIGTHGSHWHCLHCGNLCNNQEGRNPLTAFHWNLWQCKFWHSLLWQAECDRIPGNDVWHGCIVSLQQAENYCKQINSGRNLLGSWRWKADTMVTFVHDGSGHAISRSNIYGWGQQCHSYDWSWA